MAHQSNQSETNLSQLDGKLEAIFIALQAVIATLDKEIPGTAGRLLSTLEAAQALAADYSDPVRARASQGLHDSLQEFVRHLSERP